MKKPTGATNYYQKLLLLGSIAQIGLGGHVFAADGTLTNINTASITYGDSSNWVGNNIAGGVDATATVDLNFLDPGRNLTTTYLNQNVTLGTLAITNSGTFSRNLAFRGTGSTDVSTRPVLTFATTTGMPKIVCSPSTTTGVPQFNFSGTPGSGTAWILASTQGLYLDMGTSGVLSVQSSTSPWVSGYFSGPLVIARGTYDNTFTGAGGVPVTHLVVGESANPSYTAVFSTRDSVNVQGIDGTANGWLYNSTSGTVSFVDNAQTYFKQSVSTLTFGTGNDSGSFAGTVGKGPGDGASIYHSNQSLVKIGTGTQRFSGAMYNSGTTFVNAGTLLINGSHTAVISTGFSSYNALNVGTGGTYSVSATLGGTGTIKPFDTAGLGTMVNVNSGGVLAPGDGGIGTLTLDGASTTASLLSLAAGALLSFDVGGSSQADVLAITNAQASDVSFSNNTLSLNTLSGFGAGTYTLLTSDAPNTFSGLTVDGSGVITAGVQIDPAFLSTYAGSTLKLIGNNIVLNAVGGTTGLTWAGPVGAPWDHSTNSFTGTGGPTAFANGAAVTFADIAVGTVVLSGNLQPSSIAVSNTAGTYVFTGSGSISGAASLKKSGAGTLVMDAGNAYTGGTIVNAGRLIAKKLSNGTLAVNGGTVQLSLKASPNDVSGTTLVPSLSIAAGAKLDVTNNSMVIDYSGSVGTLLSDVRQHLFAGRLLSSTAGVANGIGYADNATLGRTTFSGASVDASSVLMMYTIKGDATLDGKVNTLDFNQLAGGFGLGSIWVSGDFNYDGSVDSVDFGFLAGNFGAQLPASGSLGTVVPEPITAIFIIPAVMVATQRRHRGRLFSFGI